MIKLVSWPSKENVYQILLINNSIFCLIYILIHILSYGFLINTVNYFYSMFNKAMKNKMIMCIDILLIKQLFIIKHSLRTLYCYIFYYKKKDIS